MSLPVTDIQSATLSTPAIDFLRAVPTMKLPRFVYRLLTKPSKVPAFRKQFQTGEDVVEQRLIEQHALGLVHKTVSGVPLLVITPRRIAAGMEGVVVINIHGGGFVMGTARDRTALLTAAELGVQVWSVDYDLAPEARYRIAIEQCLAVYRALVAEVPAHRIGAVSSSSGGQLMLSMLLRAHAERLPMPAAMTLYTPASDISGAGDSCVSNDGRDVVPFAMSMELMRQNYLGDTDPTDPDVSPIYADYPADFPPTLISTGTRDLLLSNCVRLHWKLLDAKVDAALLVAEGGWHGLNWEPELLEAIRVRTAVYDFMRARLPASARQQTAAGTAAAKVN